MIAKKFFADEAGFSLTELLVVIVIIGILASLTIPKFLSITTKAKSTEAKLALKQIHNLQMSYYLENDTYTNDLISIGYEQEKLKTEGGNARYKIEIIEATAAGFVAKATAVIDFDKDGTFNVWSVNQEGIIKEEVVD